MSFYQKNIDQTLHLVSSQKSGLTAKKAEKSRQKYGKNIIEIKTKSLIMQILEPFLDAFVFVLVVAGSISLYQGHKIDAIVIFIVVLANAIIQYVQSYSTEKILRELNKKNNQTVTVKRDNKIKEISSEDLVVGDIILLNEGDKVPADGRIIKSEHLSIDESMLTGESLPINKNNQTIKDKKQIFAQKNMIFGGSFLVSGQVEAVITKVGINTEFGKIASYGTNLTSVSPIQKKINKLITKIIISVGVIMPIILAIMVWRGNDLIKSLNFVLATTVSVVPEGLSIAITVILAFSMKQMAQKNALVRNLRAIETIGVINVIASDKTGTLTQNKLAVKRVLTHLKGSEIKNILKNTIIGNEIGNYTDPLDQAIANYTIKQKEVAKLIKALPFNQELALSGAIKEQSNGQKTLYLKGSPEQIVSMSDLTKKEKEDINQQLNKITESGERTIGIATLKVNDNFKDLTDLNNQKLEFAGLIGLADTIRPEAKEAVRQAQKAGVKVVMITGDHYKTAFSIANQLGIARNINQVLDMSKIDSISEEELSEKILSSTVFARVTPERKFKILEILQKNNFVAMTGDGVNDTPAIIKSDIGIAMGSGSSIAKNSSDIVLLDNNFSSIVKAMSYGRASVHNIRRMLYYMLSTNFGELLTFVVAVVFDLPLPLVAIQILWINLLTDTSFVIPLGLEKPHDYIMKQKPKPINAPLLEKTYIFRMIFMAIVISAMTLIGYKLFAHKGEMYAQTIAFVILGTTQWANAFNSRSFSKSIFKMKNRNYWLWGSLVLSAVLEIIAIFSPLNRYLKLSHLTLIDFVLTSFVSFFVIILISETHKMFHKKLVK